MFDYVQNGIALFDYDAIEEDELSFRAGDIIYLLGLAQPGARTHTHTKTLREPQYMTHAHACTYTHTMTYIHAHTHTQGDAREHAHTDPHTLTRRMVFRGPSFQRGAAACKLRAGVGALDLKKRC